MMHFTFLPSAGKRGFPAFQMLEQLNIELEETTYHNQETVITIL